MSIHLKRFTCLPYWIILLWAPNYLYGTHIVGGEITYRCLGGQQFEITLTVFRDCYNGIPNFDSPAAIGIYNAQWSLTRYLLLPYNGKDDTIPVVLDNPCLSVPPDVCVHRASYKSIVTLPFSPGGYSVVYQRCCRNKLIRNTPDPLNTGISIVAVIGEAALNGCNNSAIFKNWPPVAVCVNEPIRFDHSATDADGDSLAYRLCTPLNGPDSLNPIPRPPFPGPYADITWTDPPYNLDNVLGGIPLRIDARTGLITGTPDLIGNFVVGICVDEYRNGQIISSTRRDFQYNVADCGRPSAAFYVPDIICNTLSVQFQNESAPVGRFRWFFDWDGARQDTSTETSPRHTFPGPGDYKVALIAAPVETCADTFVKTVRLTRSHVRAVLSYQFEECSDFGLVVSAKSASVDTVYKVTALRWTVEGPGVSWQTAVDQPTFSLKTPGDYTLSLAAFSENGCIDTARVSFTAPIPPLSYIGDTLFMCRGDTVPLNPLADPAFIYRWAESPTLLGKDSPNPLAFPAASGAYFVTATDPGGICERKGTVYVNVTDPGKLSVSADPGLILLGESSRLSAFAPGALSYNWSPPQSLDDPLIPTPLATPQDTVTYYVSVFTESGCTLRGAVTLRVLSPFCGEPFIFFPTGFSPNGDGENDFLKLEGRFADAVYWAIYSRWGEKLFEAHSLDDTWDGSYKGQPMPVETYGFYLRVRCDDGAEWVKKGNVTLIR